MCSINYFFKILKTYQLWLIISRIEQKMLSLSLSHCEIKCLTLLRSLSGFTRLITQPKLLSCKTNKLNQPNKLKKFEILLVHRFHLVIFCSLRLNKTVKKVFALPTVTFQLFLSHSMCDCNTTNIIKSSYLIINRGAMSRNTKIRKMSNCTKVPLYYEKVPLVRSRKVFLQYHITILVIKITVCKAGTCLRWIFF